MANYLVVKDGAAATKNLAMAGDGSTSDPWYPCPILPVSGSTSNITGTSDTAVIAAPGASLYLYITSVNVSNSSATAVWVNIKDGATTKRTVYLGAGLTIAMAFPTPLKLTVNTALNVASETGVTAIRASATGYTAA